MSEHHSVEVMVIVEGRTEQIFIEKILAPYLANKCVYMRATQVSKTGQKGGDVRFKRVSNDILNHLKQRSDTYVSIFVDYYGLKEWPGLNDVSQAQEPEQIASIINAKTVQQLSESFNRWEIDKRFIPYLAMHEFEAMLFSDVVILAKRLDVQQHLVQKILDACGEPESINNSRETAPSKRLEQLTKNQFTKTGMGIDIAEEIGIERIRSKCPMFNQWLTSLEQLVGGSPHV